MRIFRRSKMVHLDVRGSIGWAFVVGIVDDDDDDDDTYVSSSKSQTRIKVSVLVSASLIIEFMTWSSNSKSENVVPQAFFYVLIKRLKQQWLLPFLKSKYSIIFEDR